MKKPYFFIIGLLITAMVMISTNLFAFGMGGFFTISGGNYDWSFTDGTYEESGDSGDLEDSDVGSSVSKKGFGLMLDTAIAADRVFNYRLQFSYSSISIDMEDDMEDMDVEGKEIFLYNTFGFGVVRTQDVRFWLGPQFGIGYISGEYDFSGSDYLDTNEFTVAGFNLGAIAGLNIHVGEVVSLAVDAGFRSNFLVGTTEMSYEAIDMKMESVVSGSGIELFIDFGVLFRFGETYSGQVTSSSSDESDDLDLNLD